MHGRQPLHKPERMHLQRSLAHRSRLRVRSGVRHRLLHHRWIRVPRLGHPALDGTYFFADYSTTNIWSLKYNGSNGYTDFTQRNELESASGFGVDNIGSFGRGPCGEIYILDQSGGEVFKIIDVDNPDAECNSVVCNGDVNGDNFVDGTDLSIVLGFWGDCAGCPADVSGDGQVDGLDLSIVLGYWNTLCE